MSVASPALLPDLVALRIGVVRGVTHGPLAASQIVPMQLAPYTAQVTAPDSAPSASMVTVSWTFRDTLDALPFIASNGPTTITQHVAHRQPEPRPQLYFEANTPLGTMTPTLAVNHTAPEPDGSLRFSVSFLAPLVRGTYYYHVQAIGEQYQLQYPLPSVRGGALKLVIY